MPSSNHQFLKRLYNTCSRETRPGKRRFGFYEYLYEVYAVHGQWRADLGMREIRRQIVHVTKAPLKADVHGLKLIIDACCAADYRTKSRWGQALKYVWRRRKHRTMSREEFDAFLHDHGGVVGCASRVAAPKKNAIEGRLGLGFDSLAFQKMIDSRQSEAVPESAVDGAPASDV